MGGLFSDAETGEDCAEDFVGGDLASDGAEVVEGVAEVDDHKVGGQLVCKSLGHMQQRLFHMAEGIVVAHVGEHYIGGLRQVGLRCLGQCRREGVEARAFFSRDGECAIGGCQGLRDKVYLVVDNEEVLVFEGSDVLQLLQVVEGLGEGLSGVEDIEDDVGLYYGCDGALNAEVFNRVVAVAQPCGIDDAEGGALDDKGLFDGVACGAGDVADDGAVVVQQGVEEGGFARIGTADNGDGDAALEGIAHVE